VRKKLFIFGVILVILCGLFFDVNITYKCQQSYIEEGDDIVKLEGAQIGENDIKITEIESISRTGRRYFRFDEDNRECKYIFIKEPYEQNYEI
jgi:uncharacterized protein YxeA